jgi:hypothetical protein
MQSDFALVIEKRPIKNFWKGRGGFLPIAIVERMMQGSIEDAEHYFNGRSPEGVFAVSAHYGIARDGRVWQFVNDEDTAWSNGVLQNPDLSIGWLKEVYQEKVNCNLVTLSVDYEGYSGEALTPRQYEAALALHRRLVQRWEIEPNNQHIIGHNWIDSLERSHNPGALFPFNQLLKDLRTDPSEIAQPPAQPNLLAFLESPMPEAEAEAAPPPVVETEPVAAYQPEPVEEPAYVPQVEAFHITPELNEEIDRAAVAPVEVAPATAEPENVQADVTQDQPEEASAFELPSLSTVDQPEEASSFEPEAALPALPSFPELPEVSLAAASSEAETTQVALPAEEVESEEAAVSQEVPVQPEPEEPAGEPGVVEAADEAVSQPEEALADPATVEEAAEVAPQPEETLPEIFPVEETPEAVSQDEPASVISQEAAPELVSQEAAAEAVSQPEEAATAPSYRLEDFDLADIEAALAYQPKVTRPAPARKAVWTAVQTDAQAATSVETEAPPQSAPVEEAAATEAAPEVQPEPVSPPEEVAPTISEESEEAALEAVEPEGVTTVGEPENQPEVFDAPGQPVFLADLETATFAAEDAGPVAAEPEAETATPVSGEETQPEELSQPSEETTPVEAAPVESAEPAIAAPEPASPDHDDWAADLFAGDSVPGFEESVLQEPESSVRAATPKTDELEVSPAIGDDITPKYSRPPFFDPSYTSEPTPVELTSLDEVAAEPVSEAALESAPVEAAPVTLPVEEPVEAAPAAPESSWEPAEAVAQEDLAEGVSEPSGEEVPALEPGEAVAQEAAVEAEEATGEVASSSAEAAMAEEVFNPLTEEEPATAGPEETGAVEAPVEAAPEVLPETVSHAEEASVAPIAQEAAPFAAPAPVAQERPEEKHHWYDRIFNLFGGHDNKPAPPAPASPPTQSAAPVSPVWIEASAPNQAPENVVEMAPVETAPAPATEAPQTFVTEPAADQPDSTAEQAPDIPAPGTIEAATAPAPFEAASIAQPAVLSVDFMPTAAETSLEPVESASPPEAPAADPVESVPETGSVTLQPEAETTPPQAAPVYPPTAPAPVGESFYPFELETPEPTYYDAYYGSGSVDEQPGQSSSFNYDLTGFKENPPASSSTYNQDYRNSGPSTYPFELPAEEPSTNYFQSFAPASSPVEASQPEAVIPPFSLEPEKAAAEAINLFDGAPSVTGHPQFAADDLELPSWLDAPVASEPEPEPAEAAPPTVTPPVEPVSAPPPEPAGEAATPAGKDFNWSGNTTPEDELPGWLKAAKDDSGLPEWLKTTTEPATPTPEPPVSVAPESAPPSSPAQPPNLRNDPAVEIPNKDWLENENLFEDDDFFSLLNQSGLELSLERGGTGTLNTPAAAPAASEAAPTAPDTGSAPAQPIQAAPAQPAPAAPAPSRPEPEFDNLFDEVEPDPAPAKVTVHQLIDRNDGYTAPLSFEDLDMSVPLGLDDDVTRPGTFQPVPPAPAPVAPPPPPAPTRAEPPGFHRVDLGKGRTSVELANVRTMPSYDKNTVVRVSEEGEPFEFDGWLDGPELRGSTRWYRIITPSGDEWIHSTLVQLDRPFRG